MYEGLDVETIVKTVATKVWKQYPMAELDDLIAQGYLIVVERIERYRKWKGMSLSTYLHSQLQYALSDYVRRYVIKEGTLGGMRMDIEADIGDQGIEDQVEARMQVEDILSTLEGNAQDAIKMLAQGYTMQEIGDCLGISKQRVSQIVNKVRGEL